MMPSNRTITTFHLLDLIQSSLFSEIDLAVCLKHTLSLIKPRLFDVGTAQWLGAAPPLTASTTRSPEDASTLLQRLQTILAASFPPAYLFLLEKALHYFAFVAQASKVNSMSAANLSRVIGPNLFSERALPLGASPEVIFSQTEVLTHLLQYVFIHTHTYTQNHFKVIHFF